MDKLKESDKEILKRIMSEPTFAKIRETAIAENQKRKESAGECLRNAMGATDEEVAEIESLAQSSSVLHWAGILRIIQRMRNAEASADHAWQRVEAGDKRAQSFEADMIEWQGHHDRADQRAFRYSQEVEELRATISALEAENKRLREALEPFAREASEDDGSPRADWLYVHDNELVASFFIDLTFGHFRRARDISRNRRES